MEQQTEFAARRQSLDAALVKSRAAAFLITGLPNVRYLTGFSGSNGALLVIRDRALLFTDPRYDMQAGQESDCEVKVGKGPLATEIGKWLKRLRINSVAFECNRISFEMYERLKETAPDVRWKPVDAAVEQLRIIKSSAEIAMITAAVTLNSAALEHALMRFKSSMREVELAAEIEYRMRRLGADGTAFETIVAAGPRSALPHARPTDRRIGHNQLLLVDMGAAVAGYASDMTRTHATGKLDTKIRRMYRAVLESQLAAIDTVKPGVSAAAVDGAARDVLRRYRLDKLFIHSTGHGLGLEIHERPRLGRKDRTKLKAGMVITIEPGAYLEGVGGIRIEDTVVVTRDGCEILTPTEKELVLL